MKRKYSDLRLLNAYLRKEGTRFEILRVTDKAIEVRAIR